MREARKELYLAQFGEVVDGQVVRTGGVEHLEMTRLDYSYTVGTETFTKAESVYVGVADENPVGSQIDVIYDPRNPKRAKRLADVFSEGLPEDCT